MNFKHMIDQTAKYDKQAQAFIVKAAKYSRRLVAQSRFLRHFPQSVWISFGCSRYLTVHHLTTTPPQLTHIKSNIIL